MTDNPILHIIYVSPNWPDIIYDHYTSFGPRQGSMRKSSWTMR